MKIKKYNQVSIKILPIIFIVAIILIIIAVIISKNNNKKELAENINLEVAEHAVIEKEPGDEVAENHNTEVVNNVSNNIWEDSENADTARILAEVRELLKKTDVESNINTNNNISENRSAQIETDIAEIESIIRDLEANPESAVVSVDGVTIAIDMDLTVLTGLSKEQFKTLIGKCKYDTTKFFYNNSDLIYDVCQKYQINEVFFVGLISAESAWDVRESHRVKHNYISIKGSSTDMYTFATIEEGMEVAAALLHDSYLTPSGRYYNGPTLSGVQIKFCPTPKEWVDLVYVRMQQVLNIR